MAKARSGCTVNCAIVSNNYVSRNSDEYCGCSNFFCREVLVTSVALQESTS